AQKEALKSRLALAQNDIDAARTLLREARIDEALPYQARALRNDPDSDIARAWIYDLLRDTLWFRGRAFKDLPQAVSVTFSPNGRWLAIASKENVVRVYDARSGRPIGNPDGYTGKTVAFSHDGNRIVTTSPKQPGLMVFDLRNRALEVPAIDNADWYRSAV